LPRKIKARAAIVPFNGAIMASGSLLNGRFSIKTANAAEYSRKKVECCVAAIDGVQVMGFQAAYSTQ
jgi:hypothetical protein